MSYEPLHHKYRPQTFADLVGQEAIAQTLSNAIRTERIAPAYLFTGPRGTGKTSSARILAKSLNCKSFPKPTESPCGHCEICKTITSGTALDVVEIDAASNTGVDNIREIIERSQFAPVQCRYKVYVVDECHMLSVAAFNALLKTLEEPPERVVFVLATTDPQRVLPTIISRCQKFDFRRIPLEAMVGHLQKIAAQENIDITHDAVTLVAQVAQGGLRDAESLLDQLSLLSEQVTVERVWDLVGAVPERDLMALIEAIASDNPEVVLDNCRRLMDRGREPLIVLQNLTGFYRDVLIAKTAPNRSDLVAVTPPTWKQLCEFAQKQDTSDILQGQQHLKNSEAQIKNTTQPRLWLEVTLLGLLPSALSSSRTQQAPASPMRSQNGVARNENGSHSSSPGKPSSQNSPVTNRERESPLRSADSSPQPQQPASPPIDASTTSISPTVEQLSPAQTPSRSELQKPTPAVFDATVSEVVNAVERSHPPSAVDPQSANLEQVWQQILNHIKLFSTRELLRQQCSLLAFHESIATVGISSSGLLKLAQTKLPEVEAAFETVYKFKVKVTLQLLNSTAPANISVSAATPRVQPDTVASEQLGQASQLTAKEIPRPQSTFTQKIPQATVTQPETNYSSTLTASPVQPELREQEKGLNANTRRKEEERSGFLATENSYITSTEESSAFHEASTPSPLTESSVTLSIPELEWERQEIEKALGNLKQFFEGEIIDLSDAFNKYEVSSVHPSASQDAIDDDTELLEVAQKEVQEKLDWSEPAATHHLQDDEIAALEDTQIRERLEMLGLDEDDDLPF